MNDAEISWIGGVMRSWNNLIGWINRIFLAPRSHNEDDRRREHVLNVILVGLIGLLAFAEGVVLNGTIQKGAGAETVAPLGAFSLLLLFFLGLYALSRKGFFRVASYLLVSAFFVANGYAAFRWGITIPTVLVGYALLIVMAGIVVNSKFGFMTAGAVAAYVTPMWLMQLDGLVAVDPDELVVGDGLSLIVMYFLIMTIAWLSNREIERSLIRARRSERALAEQRDRLEIEVEERTRELREAQFLKVEQLYRFAEFGQMASGLFHDLVNFFNAVLLHIQMPNQENELTVEEARERLETAGVLTKRVNGFVEGIKKQLAAKDAKENFSIRAEIEQIIQLLSYTARRYDVKVICEADDIVWFGNCFKFNQVIMNLILNAIEAYEGRAVEEADDRIVRIMVKKEMEAVSIQISDHGTGMSPETIQKIFEPFFTTKKNGKGMGIGLAITKRVIEKDFGGVLEVRSKVNEGTVFTIRFPLK